MLYNSLRVYHSRLRHSGNLLIFKAQYCVYVTVQIYFNTGVTEVGDKVRGLGMESPEAFL